MSEDPSEDAFNEKGINIARLVVNFMGQVVRKVDKDANNV